MSEQLFLLQVLSALHIGGEDSGDGFIDQPVAREAANGFPLAPGSALKGVLRDESRFWSSLDENLRKALFGTESGSSGEGGAQGALTVGDARLLCLPMRSLAGVFAWVTCPLVLGRFVRELRLLGMPIPPLDIPSPVESELVLVSSDSELMMGSGNSMYLGPLKAHRLQGCIESNAQAWAEYIADLYYGLEANETDCANWSQAFIERFAIVSNTVFNYLSQTGLELRPRIAINDDTGIATNLWYVEAIPPETMLWGVVRLSGGRGAGVAYSAAALESHLPRRCRIQLGGSATVGFGQCLWLRPHGVANPANAGGD